jgi:hypothetical protein
LTHRSHLVSNRRAVCGEKSVCRSLTAGADRMRALATPQHDSKARAELAHEFFFGLLREGRAAYALNDRVE